MTREVGTAAHSAVVTEVVAEAKEEAVVRAPEMEAVETVAGEKVERRVVVATAVGQLAGAKVLGAMAVVGRVEADMVMVEAVATAPVTGFAGG